MHVIYSLAHAQDGQRINNIGQSVKSDVSDIRKVNIGSHGAGLSIEHKGVSPAMISDILCEIFDFSSTSLTYD